MPDPDLEMVNAIIREQEELLSRRMQRFVEVANMIPRNLAVTQGTFPCPVCGGMVTWTRRPGWGKRPKARSERIMCSTLGCVRMMG